MTSAITGRGALMQGVENSSHGTSPVEARLLREAAALIDKAMSAGTYTPRTRAKARELCEQALGILDIDK